MPTITGRLTQVDRLPSSRYGNPRFEVTLDNADTYRTGVDAAVGYEVLNFRIGQQVTLTVQGSRRSVVRMILTNQKGQ
jgi:hypothetical protein